MTTYIYTHRSQGQIKVICITLTSQQPRQTLSLCVCMSAFARLTDLEDYSEDQIVSDVNNARTAVALAVRLE